jgi:DNA-binding IclR family transcriptional regulator
MQNQARGRKKPERNPVSKALRALGWLIQGPATEVGVRHLAGALNLRPSNAHRLLATLVEEGFVQQDVRTARYSLGPELLRWAHLIIARAPLREIAMHHMRALVDACNETAFLGLYDAARQEMMFAANVESEHPLRYAIELNRWMPMNSGASSLAILAFLTKEEIAAIMAQSLRLPPLTPNAITSASRLSAELAATRRRGYAFSRGQRLAGAIGIAAPIFASGGQVIGDLVLTIPEQRFERRSTGTLARLLRKHAAAISADIGGSPPVSLP